VSVTNEELLATINRRFDENDGASAENRLHQAENRRQLDEHDVSWTSIDISWRRTDAIWTFDSKPSITESIAS